MATAQRRLARDGLAEINAAHCERLDQVFDAAEHGVSADRRTASLM
ncbi:hypothetical protein [Streptomyces sp. NPDC054794]